MKFGIFYEHQPPRPWAAGAEEEILQLKKVSGLVDSISGFLQYQLPNLATRRSRLWVL